MVLHSAAAVFCASCVASTYAASLAYSRPHRFIPSATATLTPAGATLLIPTTATSIATRTLVITKGASLFNVYKGGRIRPSDGKSFSCPPAPARASGASQLLRRRKKKMGSKADQQRPDSLQIPRCPILATLGGTTDESSDELKKSTDEYTDDMQQAMGTSLTYRHDLGMNYSKVLPDLIVGSCLQTPADVDRLKEAGVRTIFCLQQDQDLAYFSIDIGAIQGRAAEVEGIEHIRAPIRDFDPYDLRLRLPAVIAILYRATQKYRNHKGPGSGTVYVHCTAGLGRAPTVALTFMYWILGYDLVEANSTLQAVRYCVPNLESIRAATADVLAGNPTKPVLFAWKGGAHERVEIAGLDVGWNERIALERGADGHWYVERNVPVASFEFKYVVDGVWKCSPEFPVTSPNKDGQINNQIQVQADEADARVWEFRKQIVADDFVLTDEHRKLIRQKLEILAPAL